MLSAWQRFKSHASGRGACNTPLMYAGKLAYERGRYQESVVLFEKALNDEGWMSRLGGEIQLWLALAYQARCVLPHRVCPAGRNDACYPVGDPVVSNRIRFRECLRRLMTCRRSGGMRSASTCTRRSDAMTSNPTVRSCDFCSRLFAASTALSVRLSRALSAHRNRVACGGRLRTRTR